MKKTTTNSHTEHSRKLRADTANKYISDGIKSGKLKRLSYQGPTDRVDEIRERIATLSKESWLSGLESINFLLDFYYENK